MTTIRELSTTEIDAVSGGTISVSGVGTLLGGVLGDVSSVLGGLLGSLTGVLGGLLGGLVGGLTGLLGGLGL
ncbi:hypothetical protein [Acidiphilium acidophilum]|uniref:Uncharacterized protein n=1 Tax=Acidiphilium acidophilum TaxID=76588 RepID=A0AAW9DMU6_ACIAO|nr:hypothetical protein [Acidiphilium acidophilum]MDX5930371.1 hypothetical protein [Acidiphilium acidophilum]GBQ06865.1 hypothetical protein AA700_0849 [Acidiphilium acidophilum DSM 700]